MKKAVLFDMDGILYDSEGYYLDGTVKVMRELGYQGPEECLYETVGKTADGTWQILYDLLEGEYTRNEIQNARDAYVRKHPLDCLSVMFPDIPAALERLKRHGYLMACCSSNQPAEIRRCLREMGIREYFSCVISSEEIERAKPDPMIYLMAAEQIGAEPENCYVYEDSTPGIESGRRAGMKVIARKDDRFRQDQSRADKIVLNAAEMCRYIIGGETK
ncbi:MAG: HAD family phosphatase [Solobacterium sp.]|nr:HAD family phosphatase [Solobacterium sp.]